MLPRLPATAARTVLSLALLALTACAGQPMPGGDHGAAPGAQAAAPHGTDHGAPAAAGHDAHAGHGDAHGAGHDGHGAAPSADQLVADASRIHNAWKIIRANRVPPSEISFEGRAAANPAADVFALLGYEHGAAAHGWRIDRAGVLPTAKGPVTGPVLYRPVDPALCQALHTRLNGPAAKPLAVAAAPGERFDLGTASGPGALTGCANGGGGAVFFRAL
ncbi:MAG TPA: hypothetical protein VEH84_18830 [Alphaproteobacteria bacterium]|nr:hypothetical protein [Alphaproteobacteria bacterium]